MISALLVRPRTLFYSLLRTVAAVLFTSVSATARADVSSSPDDLGFAERAVSITEQFGAEAVLVVRRTAHTDLSGTVAVTTRPGSAEENLDFIPVDTVLDFPSGVVERTVSVPLVDDGLAVGTRMLTVSLHSPEGLVLGPATNATVTIREDDSNRWAVHGVLLRPAAGVTFGNRSALAYFDASETFMNYAFGEDGYRVDTFEDIEPEDLFTPATEFLYLEASGDHCDALRNFLAGNRSRLAAWVEAGGRLLISVSAPAADFTLPFDASVHPRTTTNATLRCGTSHPLYSIDKTLKSTILRTRSPTASVADSAFSLPADFTPLVTDDDSGEPVVAEAWPGKGHVVFSTLNPYGAFYFNKTGNTSGVNLWQNLVVLASDFTASLFVSQEPLHVFFGTYGDADSFSPTGRVYSAGNYGGEPISYAVSSDAAWLRASPVFGTLGSMAYDNIALTLDPLVYCLAPGTYSASVTFSDITSGTAVTREFALVVSPPAGHIADVFDSIAPTDDFSLPFPPTPVGLYTDASVSLRNSDPNHAVQLVGAGIFYLQDGSYPDIDLPTLASFPIEIPADSTLTLPVRFSPTFKGLQETVLTFYTNDPDTPAVEFAISGTGVSDYISLSPKSLAFSGHPGGPFAPEAASLVLSNRSATVSQTWALRRTPEWLAVSAMSGTLAPNESRTLSVAPAAPAEALPAGDYTVSLLLTNKTSAVSQSVDVTLSARALPVFSCPVSSVVVTGFLDAAVSAVLPVHNDATADGPLHVSVATRGPTYRAADSLYAAPAPVGAKASAPASDSPAASSFIVCLEDDGSPASAPAPRPAVAEARSRLVTAVNAAGGSVRRFSRTSSRYAVVDPPADASAPAFRARLAGIPGVRSVHPNRRYRLLSADVPDRVHAGPLAARPVFPDDPAFLYEWHLFNTNQFKNGVSGIDIRAPEAWRISTGSPRVVVAVVDSALHFLNPDLASNVWNNPGEIPSNGIDDDGNGFVDDVHGWNFADDTCNLYGGSANHGTHVAGLIGAAGNNGDGIAGVCWQVSLMGVRFMDDTGYGETLDAIDAIDYAVSMGARVINASWGGDEDGSDGEDDLLAAAVARAEAAGVLFVAAAGNDGKNIDSVPYYPASYAGSNIVTVASVTQAGGRSSFSNYGAVSVDIAAPGGGGTYNNSKDLPGTYLTSTVDNESLGYKRGTSMAAPLVSGAAALLLSEEPGLTPFEIKDILRATARKILPADVCASGLLDAEAALRALPPDWLAVAVPGPVAPGNSGDIALAFDPTGLAEGTYTATIVLRTDDPAEPARLLPVVYVVRDAAAEAWREEHGLAPDGSEDALDADADGLSNRVEYLLGTDPLDARSALRITGFEEISGEDGGFRVSWPGADGLRFRVFSADKFGHPFVPLSDEIPGVSPLTGFIDSAPASASRFYKVSVELDE